MSETDLMCVACGYPIQYNQRGGFTVCGHGNIHYNCSYLGNKCEICSGPLMFDINQSENDFLSFDFTTKQSSEESQNVDNTHVHNMLTELKEMIVNFEEKQTRMINELKEEIKDFKSKETKINDLQNDILTLKYDKILKDQKVLEEKINKLTASKEL